MRIGIVGGGLSGLTAAFYARRLVPNCDVCVVESGERIGGTIRTERIDGYLLEHGADMFATQPPAALQLCQDLGIDQRLISPQSGARGAAIVSSGRLVKIPDGFVLMRPTRMASMIATPLLSVAGKFRLLCEGCIGQRKDQTDESIASFVSRRLGPEVLRRIVQPLVGGIYVGDCEKLSMAATMGQFQNMEREDGSLWAATMRRRRQGIDTTERNSAGARYEQFRSFPGGIEELLNALAASLTAGSIHTGRAVTGLQFAATPETHDCNGQDSGGQDRIGQPSSRRWIMKGCEDLGRFDQVIVAVPAAASARLIGDVAPDAARWASTIQAASSAVVALGVKQSDIARPIDIAGFVVPEIENRRILAASFTSDKFAGRAPEGEKLIRVFFGGCLQPEVLRHSDDELVEIARQELAELIGLGGTPKLVRVIRWNEAMPQYHVGHNDRIAEMEAALKTVPGLHVIGNSFRGVGIAPTVAAARAAVQQIATESNCPSAGQSV
jgi:oxygen-dependent protoporphyrinogen oxidase